MDTRRRVLGRLTAAASALGVAGCLGAGGRPERSIEGLEPNPRADRLPDRQFAQNEFLRTDAAGNRLQSRFRRLLLLDLDVEPSAEAAKTVERAMRTLEAAYDWSPAGLFHALAWGTDYFERLGRLDGAPIDRPEVLSRTDDPRLESFDAMLVLESDVPSRLGAAESAMFGSRASLGGASVERRLGEAFSVVGRRTGFLGEGLPAKHADAEGVPAESLSESDPMFMGFFSGRKGTQAGEDRVAIEDGPYAGGTTLHLSHLRQDLGKWFESLDDEDRVARMFSPEFSPEEIADLGADVPFADAVREHAREADVVGHHEKVAQVRKRGEPLVLRRDFNTVDGGRAGVHFLSLQRHIKQFRRTRKAMNGWYVRDDSPEITDRRNNGILNFVSVVSRANFYVPPRDRRAFPLGRL